MCRHHHERWDGSGYPDRLAGYDITPWVQVVGLADAFDALVHPRVYKPAFPLRQAAGMIEHGACGTFAPRYAGLLCPEHRPDLPRGLWLNGYPAKPRVNLTDAVHREAALRRNP